ncbi:MAG: M67 family metallopeptidase [Deltaproteobacteria bacterium]|jgi:proteasome lid subunit RPN8/RPN11|nr:M67 family metallopeptidase [Deltaproteobacteria bacterium]
MRLRLKLSDYLRILEHARAGLPNEACGLIAGRLEEDARQVEKVYTLNNPDACPEHFSIPPQAQLEAIRDMRSLGLVLLGSFHSHPNTPARPSDEDINLAYDPAASCCILSLAGAEPVLKCFRIERATRLVREESIELTPSSP